MERVYTEGLLQSSVNDVPTFYSIHVTRNFRLCWELEKKGVTLVIYLYFLIRESSILIRRPLVVLSSLSKGFWNTQAPSSDFPMWQYSLTSESASSEVWRFRKVQVFLWFLWRLHLPNGDLVDNREFDRKLNQKKLWLEKLNSERSSGSFYFCLWWNKIKTLLV